MEINYTKLTDKETVESIAKSDKIVIVVNGSLKQVTFDKLIESIKTLSDLVMKFENLNEFVHTVDNNIQSLQGDTLSLSERCDTLEQSINLTNDLINFYHGK